MKSTDLAVMDLMPVVFWAKDVKGVYIWGNKTINSFAGGPMVGKTDDELPWADTADALIAHDQSVLESGKPDYSHGLVHKSARGEATLNVCKFPGDLDGERCTFGISFIIEE